MSIDQTARFFEQRLRDRLHQVDILEMMFELSKEGIGLPLEQISRSLASSDCRSKFYSRYARYREGITVSRICEAEHLRGPGLSNVQLHERAGIEVISGQLTGVRESLCRKATPREV